MFKFHVKGKHSEIPRVDTEKKQSGCRGDTRGGKNVPLGWRWKKNGRGGQSELNVASLGRTQGEAVVLDRDKLGKGPKEK